MRFNVSDLYSESDDRDTVYILYLQRHSHVNSQLSRLARGVDFFLFSQVDTGSSPTRTTKFFKLRRLHLYFKFHIFVNLFCFSLILLNIKNI